MVFAAKNKPIKIDLLLFISIIDNDPFGFVNHGLGWVNTPHGRVVVRELARSDRNFVNEFHLRDHLGNTRVVAEASNNNYLKMIQGWVNENPDIKVIIR